MYDVASMGSIPYRWSDAMQRRQSMKSLGEVSCERPGIPEAESWQYDQSEGINSIVNDVGLNRMLTD